MEDIVIALDPDGRSVGIRIKAGDTVVKVDAAGLSALIRTLGELRMRMKPEIARERPRDPLIPAISDPKWGAAGDVMDGSSLLTIRDPRYGWITYAFPPPTATRLAGIFLSQAKRAPNALKSSKPN